MRSFALLFFLMSVIAPWQGASTAIKQKAGERDLQGETLVIGEVITQPPMPVNPDLDTGGGNSGGTPETPVSRRYQVNATYSYFLYTDLNRNQAAGEVQDYLQTKLEEIISDLVGNVQLSSYKTTLLFLEPCEGPPTSSRTPDWIPSTFTTCGKYRAVLVAEMGTEWLEDVFQRTVVRTMETYIDEWNNSQQATYVQFHEPIEVRCEISLLLLGARQLMGIYEYSFMADVMQIGALDRRAKANEDPPFIITDVKYVWQRIVSRDGTVSGGGSQRRRFLQGTAADPPPTPKSNLVRLLVVATCAGDSCTNENLETFVTTTMDETNDVYFENLKDWSQTNYFRSGIITGVVVDKQDEDKFVEVPELPPESDYRTPGVQENDPPLWIWFALLIAAASFFVACIYVTFCLTARDFQAARELRKEHWETKQKAAAASAGAAAAARDSNETKDEEEAPRSPAAHRYFRKKAPATPDPDENVFDVSESNPVGDDNIEEVPPSPSASPKKKKKKKSSSSKKKSKKGLEALDGATPDA
eukprot:scaffold5828_cov168-Amphora_coffeaeformis.AAC.20